MDRNGLQAIWVGRDGGNVDGEVFVDGWKQRRWTQSKKEAFLGFLEVGFEVSLRLDRHDCGECNGFEVKVQGLVVGLENFEVDLRLGQQFFSSPGWVHSFLTKLRHWRNIQSPPESSVAIFTVDHCISRESSSQQKIPWKLGFDCVVSLSRVDREVEWQAKNFYFNLWSRKSF